MYYNHVVELHCINSYRYRSKAADSKHQNGVEILSQGLFTLPSLIVPDGLVRVFKQLLVIWNF